ncbi:RHS repeat-associated core domain-containing protein [Mycobacterium camsae]|uniref:RHS repeat-associated core domain-containing protein n=1 Tax=Mycobacterium gordonae TaxID=1778 RepID=UPI0019806917|nr:RHS repeat-associated core domain-containing protein [Mycobacterium gordonae]
MAPLDVDPRQLSGAGDKLSGDGDGLAAALATLTGGISGAYPGHDGAAIKFGTEYLKTGQGLLKAGAAAISASQRMGYGIKMSAYNYALANAASIPGGGTPSLPIPPCPAPHQAPGMSSPFGPGIAEPLLWVIVEQFVGDYWPDGNPGSLRAAGGAWAAFAEALNQTAADVALTEGQLAGQHLPEAGLMFAAINSLCTGMLDVARQCMQVANALTSFAGKVETTQNAIRDLLNRLNPMSGSLVGLAVSLFEDGDPLATIKAVADDIKAVLSHMKDEAAADQWVFGQVMGLVDSTTDSLERWVSKEFPTVAPVVNAYLDIENGVIHSAADTVQGIEGLDPTRFLYDPQGALKTWKDMADTLGMGVPPILITQLATNPQGVLDRVKALVDAKDWSGDHPLRGLGHNIGDIAQFFIPGVGEAKPAAAAAETSARLSEAGVGLETRLASEGAGDATGLLSRAGEAGGDLSTRAGKVASDLDQLNAPTIEPPRPSPGPDGPPQRALPADHPNGPPPPSQPGLPAAETKPTAVPHEPATPPEHPTAHTPTEPVQAPRTEPAPHNAPLEPAHPSAPDQTPGPHAPNDLTATPHTEPPPPAHPPAEARELPVSERPAGEHPTGRAPAEPGGAPHAESPTAPHPTEHTPSELLRSPHDDLPAGPHPPGEPGAAPHAEPGEAGEHARTPPPHEPGQVRPVEAPVSPGHPPQAAPAAPGPGTHLPPVSEMGAKPVAAASGEATRTAAQAAEAAKAPPVAPTEAAGARSLPSEARNAPADGAHGPADTPAGLADRTAPAGDRSAPGGGPREGHPGDPHLPENDHDPFAQADHDRGLAEDAREPGSSRELADCCANGEPVNMATGEYFLPMTDIELPGVLPLLLTRQHRSKYRRGVWFGPSWTSTFDARVVVTEDAVTTVGADGALLSFAHPSPDRPERPRHGRNWLLFATTDGGYRLLSQDTERSYHFEPKNGLNGTDLALGVLSISAITDRYQNRILFSYTDNGIPSAVEHSGGYRIEVHSDGARITGYDLASPSGTGIAVRRFGYVGGDLAAVTDGCGATTTFVYDRDHQMVSWTDSVGAHYENVYGTDGRITSQQGTDGVWAGTFDYVSTAEGLVSTYTDAYGAQTAYQFDADLQPRKVLDPENRLTTTEFNRWRDPLAVTDPTGARTQYEYTEDGDIATLTDALGAVTQIDYAGPRRPTRIARQGHSPTSLSYDAAGNVVEVACDGASRRYEHNSAGALIAIIDEEGRRTRITVNAAGLPTRITDPAGATTDIDYDLFGRAVAVTDPRGHRTTVTRDAEGRVLRRVAADASRQSWRYDGEGNCLIHIDELGARTRFEYGLYDKLTARIAPDGSRTEYRYDQARRLIEVVNPDGLAWRYAYYLDGRLRSQTDFNGATTAYRYDPVGRLAEKTNAEGQSIRYTYDALGRIITEATDAAMESDAFAGELTRYRYGPDGHLIEAANVHGTGTYRYDGISRTCTASWDGRLVESSFDAAGHLVGVRSPSGVRADYTYDSRGLLSAVRAAGRAINLHSDAAGWITRAEVGRTTLQREFDPLGRLLAQSLHASTEGQLFLESTPRDPVLTQSAYTYRPDGALITRMVDLVDTRYQLDALARVNACTLNGAVAEEFGYDATNNITTAGPPNTEPRHQRWDYRRTLLLDDGRSHYSYDRAGRLIRTVTRRLGRKPEVWHYRWDAYDRLRMVTTPDGQIWAYGYDHLNRRTHKTNTTNGNKVLFTWLGDQLLEQTTVAPQASDTSPRQTTTWAYLPDAPTPVAQITTTANTPTQPPVDIPLRLGTRPPPPPTPAGEKSQPDIDRAFFAIITDHIGTPTHLIDPATATVSGRASTTLWGHTTWTGATSTPLRFPGQYHDPETGWHYNRHRYYHPHTARYTTPDPLGLAPAPNPHTYAQNPTTTIDPLGLAPIGACEQPHHDSGTRGSYSPVAEARIPREMWQHSDARHFQEANRQLYHQVLNSPDLLDFIESRYPGTMEHVTPSRVGEDGLPNGQFSRRPPPGLTWHHHELPGLMQLVDRIDHATRHGDYHPKGYGGRAIWGGGSTRR